ncbi:MAG: CDP-alcohol phosphatidyltransferase family protein [Chlamydiae bacterium]|nr:CDP-alcohol phosphatidyltransferase family protein [Chlamydiota bacterium]MBI3266250.1 CDP-alcohol phosphatidyltransferase family protein [Chlamydiota bacterium]
MEGLRGITVTMEAELKKSTLNLANRITLGRIFLVPLFVVLLLGYLESDAFKSEWLRIGAMLSFGIAILTDALDGFIARTRHQQTRLGTFLDPLADKLLLTSAIILLALPNHALQNRLPFWFVVLVISRDVFITLGALLIHILNGSVKIVPSVLGKVTTFSQMVTVFWILLKWPHADVPIWIAAIATFASWIGYLIYGSRQLNGSGKVLSL